ncbi:MAG: NADH-quinone oxidoreductase subunit J [Sulfuricella sp.]|nr:NADH-quinone oxidoreductase subunit J [Sulfuricella sp.]
MNFIFYLAAAVAILATILVVTRSNAVHALLYLIVSLLAVALVFFLLGAPFAAALEVIIYAGAIMVLFVFVVMMLNLGEAAVRQESQWLNYRTWAGPSALAAVLLGELVYVLYRGKAAAAAPAMVEAKTVGIVLFGPYLMAVELASMLLLAGLIGAWHLGRREGGGG